MLEKVLREMEVIKEGRAITLDKLFDDVDRSMVEETICSNMIEEYGLVWIRIADEKSYTEVYESYATRAAEFFANRKLH